VKRNESLYSEKVNDPIEAPLLSTPFANEPLGKKSAFDQKALVDAEQNYEFSGSDALRRVGDGSELAVRVGPDTSKRSAPSDGHRLIDPCFTRILAFWLDVTASIR
jgi:hypothetical protein